MPLVMLHLDVCRFLSHLQFFRPPRLSGDRRLCCWHGNKWRARAARNCHPHPCQTHLVTWTEARLDSLKMSAAIVLVYRVHGYSFDHNVCMVSGCLVSGAMPQ